MKDINAQEKKTNINDSFVVQAQRQGRMGWFAFTIVLLILMLQNLFYALKPKDVWAADKSGNVIGQVVFDESRYRSNDDVISDIKSWVVNCYSVNKITIINDESVCLTHLNDTLSEDRYKTMLSNQWIEKVLVNGCNKTDYRFNDIKTVLNHRNYAGYQAEMTLSGTVICSDSGTPVTQDFYVNVHARLKPRTENEPLAIEVYQMDDL